MKKKHLPSLLKSFIPILCIIAILGTGFAYAADRRTVKVAFFPMDSYHILGENGSYGGMDVDYLTELSKYSRWKIEYVNCTSWDDALAKLEAHEVDLVGSAQYSAERAEIFDYADLASGYTYGIIATNGNGTIAYEDFDTMADITFGMVKTYVRQEEFFHYLAAHGIDQPKMKLYDSTQLLHAALDAGEVDAMVHTFMEVKTGQRLIGRFAPKPVYYITWKGNDSLLRELNSAIADLKFNQPELETELISEYYESKLDKSVLLTSAEQKYLEQKQTITVGYLNNHYPFSYTDEDTGEFAGLSRILLENTLLWTGVTLEYREFKNHEEAHAALDAGEIDIQAYCIQHHEPHDGNYIKEMTAYVHLPLVIVSDGMHSFDDIKTVATVNAFSYFTDQTVSISPATVIFADNQIECLQMLANGEVDAVLCDGYLAENELRTNLQYQHLKISTVLNIDHSAHMVIHSPEDSKLESILSKTLSTISVKDINDYVFEENTYPLLSINTFIRNNSVPITLILFCLSVVVILVAVHMVHDSRKIQRLMYKEPDMDIWNLNYLFYQGEKLVQAERKDRYAVVCLGVYNLRNYSIIFGWESGQQLLEIIKDVLEKCIDEKKEIYARYHVGRFILLLKWNDWDLFVERLENIQKLAEEFIFSKMENRMQIPMGVYEIPSQTNNLRTAANCASQALELAMKGNVNDKRITAYSDSIEVTMMERHKTETLLEMVDIPKNFTAYYQHKVDIRTGKIVGAEALVRFLDPTADRAVRSPSVFIPYYEQTGRIIELDFFVLESVCKMLRKRLDEGKIIVPISCNFSRLHFTKPNFPEHFEEILQKYQISKELIEVEITETLVTDELQEHTIRDTLFVLKEKGIRLSIDDFGAGYSSLGSFVHVPASTLKLDRSFLLNDENPERQLKIMRGIVRMSEELDAGIVCEGVETEKDLNIMQQIEAYIAQGYYYSKPEPQDRFEANLDAQQ